MLIIYSDTGMIVLVKRFATFWVISKILPTGAVIKLSEHVCSAVHFADIVETILVSRFIMQFWHATSTLEFGLIFHTFVDSTELVERSTVTL